MRIFAVLALLLTWCPSLLAEDDLKAFPKSDEGFQRHVLRLPEADDEDLMKVEIIVGKTVETDSVNNYFFSGHIEAVNIEGWGYTRYVVKELGPMAGTLIGVPPGAPKAKRFMSLGGEPYLVRYNSRLPLVIYLPEGAEARYRIWRADKEVKPVPKG
jgi:ecotin